MSLSISADTSDLRKPIQMSERSSFIGEWWLPKHKKNKVIGVCTFDPSGSIRLSLEGYFKQQNFDTVYGYASGRKITLLDCFKTSIITPLHEHADYVSTSIVANKAIIDSHTVEEKEICVKEMEVETTDIIPWSYFSGINRDNISSIPSKMHTERKFELIYELQNPKVIYKNSEVEITLNSSVNVPLMYPPSQEFLIKERNYFKVLNKTSKKGLFIIEYADAIRKFISIATRNNVDLRKIIIKFKKDEISYAFMQFKTIQIDYKASGMYKPEMFFIFPEIENKIIDLFDKWISGYRKMPAVYNLYFYESGDMLFKIFLSKAQALEEFHRRTKIRSKDWGFKSRISNLFERFSVVMNHTGDKEAFAQLMLDHRDYYIHWFQKKQNKIFRDARLDYLTRDANLLLEMCLMSEMGFDDSDIINIVKKNAFYGYYIQSPERVKWALNML